MREMNLESLVYSIRGQQVMLDSDLAMIYGYEVKALNQQVKRNIERFPEDFMFRLSDDEVPERLRSQNVTLNEEGNKRGMHRKYLPYAFTEQGVNMLATVLKSDAKIEAIQESIQKINENFVLDTELKNFVIYRGQKLESDMAYIDIYKKAKHSIYVVDDYVSIKTLHLLSHKKPGVHVILFTENGHGHSRDRLTASEVTDFNNEYPTIQIKPNPDCHDRFIILDYGTKTEKAFHCGASSKDGGNKVCCINAIESTGLLYPVINKLLQNPDKVL